MSKTKQKVKQKKFVVNNHFKGDLFASDIYSYRLSRGEQDGTVIISLNQAALELNMSKTTLHKAEANKGRIDVVTIVEIANWMKQPVSKYF